MKTLFKSVLCTLVIAASSVYTVSAQASNTGSHVIQRIQTTSVGHTYFRPQGLGSWGGNDCPDATYAHIATASAAYEQIVSLAVASKLNNSKMIFYGTCSDNGNYLAITYAYLL